jgi:hypothetical protein
MSSDLVNMPTTCSYPGICCIALAHDTLFLRAWYLDTFCGHW